MQLIWYTEGFSPKSVYAISALIPPFQDEFDKSNNLLVDGYVKLKIFADVNGDGKVNVSDIILVLNAMWARKGKPNWDERCDLMPNGKIDIWDLGLVIYRYGKS